jgi:hypothetical protein
MIKVTHEGVDYYCETADEAVDLGAKLRGTTLPGSKRVPHSEHAMGGSRWTVTRFQSFITQLRDKQRKFLSLVLNSPDGVTDSSLRQSLGVSTNKGFGPILTGISRRAKKAGVSLQDIVTSEKVQLSANEKVTEFKATAAFAQIAKDAGGIK